MAKKVAVKTSKAHRRGATYVRGYYRRSTKNALRIKKHTRYARSDKNQIAKRGGTRKAVRKERKTKTAQKQIAQRPAKYRGKFNWLKMFGK